MSEWAETWSDDEENELDVIINFIKTQQWSEIINRAEYVMGLERIDKSKEIVFFSRTSTVEVKLQWYFCEMHSVKYLT